MKSDNANQSSKSATIFGRNKLVVEEMENAIKLSVPIKVDYNFGSNWYEAH